MNRQEQGKKTNAVTSDAAVPEPIPANSTALSDEDLDKVAGGATVTITVMPVNDPPTYTVKPLSPRSK